MAIIISTILFLPLAASVAITLFTLKNKKLSGLLSISSLVISFLLSLYLFKTYTTEITTGVPLEFSYTWLETAGLTLEWGYLINPLALTMLLVVTGIGSLIFIYSWGYMSGDKGWSRYFACLSFFAFAMMGITLANNFLQIFIFWELVGLASYLLIAFWFEREPAAVAGKKAFIVNKVGDIFFLFGILLIWYFSAPDMARRTLNFLELEKKIGFLGLGPVLLTALSLLVFAGVAGKSAQFPLHVWLPDAMEGPTPVSALIHAATMVAAGVYLLARVFFLFELAPIALWIVGLSGLITCILAGLIAFTQDDIKRILAYSTLSQLGYMVIAVASGAPEAGMFHLVTHACFKALLFLGAGSVIHACLTQDIWQMGGVLGKMRITSYSFLIGTLALAGIFPLSGFFSKDLILAAAEHSNHVFFLGALIAVFLTAFYMGRLFVVVFLGKPSAHVAKSHESPRVMTWPLIILAVLSVFAGFLPIEKFLTGHAADPINLKISLVSSGLAVAGFTVSFLLFYKKKTDAAAKILGPVWTLFQRKFFIDEVYNFFAVSMQNAWAALLGLLERRVVLAVEETAPEKTAGLLSGFVSRIQSGGLSLYALLFVTGLFAAVLWVMLGVK